jgi:hypothetical protein
MMRRAQMQQGGQAQQMQGMGQGAAGLGQIARFGFGPGVNN